MTRGLAWTAVIAATALAALCVHAARGGAFAFAHWDANGTRAVLIFAGAWTLATVLLVRAPRPLARTLLLVLFVVTAAGSAGLGPVAATLLVLAAATALGDRVLPLGGFDWRRRPPLPLALAVTTSIGAALLMGLASVALHAPVNTRLSWATVLVTVCVANRHGLIRWARALRTWIGGPEADNGGTFLLAGLASALLFGHLLIALLPEISHDGLAYHLVLPEYVENHARWSFDFRNFVWAVMPLGAEALWTPAYLLGGEQAVRLMAFAALLAVVGGLYGLVRAWSSRPWAWLAIAMFVSAPLTVLETAHLHVENTLAAFLVAAFALTTTHGDPMGRRKATAVAILLGGALATKLLAVFAIAPLGLWLAWRLIQRHGWRGGVARATLCAVVIVVVGGVAYGHAWVSTGNPVFPFFNGVFHSPFWEDTDMYNQAWRGNLSWDLPWQATVHSGRFLESRGGALGFQYLLFLPFLLGVTVSSPNHRRNIAGACVVFLLGFAGTFGFQQYLRYIYPWLPILTLALIASAARLTNDTGTRRAIVALGLTVVVANTALAPAAASWLRWGPFAAVFSAEEREAVVRQHQPLRFLIDRINLTHGPHARVAFMAPALGGGLEGTPLYYSWHNPSFLRAVGHVDSLEQIEQNIASLRITHVVTSAQDYPNRPLFEQFLAQHTRYLVSLEGAELYRVDRDLAHGEERIRNDEFLEGNDGWVTIGEPGPVFDRPTNTVRIAHNQHVAQRVTLGTLGSCRLEVRGRSLPGDATALVTLAWHDRDGAVFEREHRSPGFDGNRRSVRYFFAPPAGAAHVTVRLTTFGTETIEIHGISLRQ